MTPAQKEEIYKLRLRGLGYKAIAREMLLSVDAIKGYCKRHHLNGPTEVVELNAEVIKEKSGLCLNCKNPIRQKKRGRTKKFCTDTCRYKWWNENRTNHSTSDISEHVCEHCGKPFNSYGNKKRKYCSHNCYIKYRFWGEEDGV